MGGIWILTCQLKRIIGLNRNTNIEITVVIKRPAPAFMLSGTQVASELLLNIIINVSEKMIEKNIFGWNRGVSFKLKSPMTIVSLLLNKP